MSYRCEVLVGGQIVGAVDVNPDLFEQLWGVTALDLLLAPPQDDNSRGASIGHATLRGRTCAPSRPGAEAPGYELLALKSGVIAGTTLSPA